MTVQTEIKSPSESPISIQDENVFSVIRNRRSTRSYLAKPVSRELIKSLIELSIQAPSAMNLQPWSFVVIQNPSVLKDLSDHAKKKLFKNPEVSKEFNVHGHQYLNDSHFNIFYDAPVLIVICAKEEGNDQFSAEADCYLAGENLMLSATGMGLATCPIGLALDSLCEQGWKKRLGIPGDYTPVLPIIVGYPSESTPPIHRNPPIIKWI